MIHFDLKPDNLLIGEDGNLKIGDFGECYWPAKEKELCKRGTMLYRSPECRGRTLEGIDSRSDVWAAGLNMINFAIGNENFEPFIVAINELDSSIDKPTVENLIDQAFINLDKTPELNKFISLMKQVLDPNPDTRISIAKLRKKLEFYELSSKIDSKLITNIFLSKGEATNER